MVIKSNLMRKILTLALLLSFACSEETELRCKSCINMTISDALPIQFWLNDCPTYNEKESCGVHSFCWNQKFHCDDEIRLQVTNTEEGQELSLQLLNEDGNLVSELPFESTDFTKQVPIVTPLQFDNTDFSSDLTGWSSFGGSDRVSSSDGAAWAYSAGNARAFSFSASKTKYFATERPDNPGLGWPPGSYAVRITANSNGGSDLNVRVYSMPDGNSQTLITSVSDGVIPDDNNTHIVNVTFTLSAYSPYLAFTFDGTPATTTSLNIEEMFLTSAPDEDVLYSRTTYDLAFIPSELSPDLCNEKVQFVIVDDNASPAEIAKSDFIEFSTELGCTELIKYRNQRNFAGIDYENLYDDSSPAEAEYFYLRIPAVFFHQQFPGESEAIELSDSKFITLNGVMREQTRLETDYMPYYMHKKIQLILMHQYVEIDSRRWTKQDAYEIQEGNKRYPLKMAKCWLTERNFVARNVV